MEYEIRPVGLHFDNDRAIRLYEKPGFQKEGLRRMATVRKGAYIDEYMMSRLRPGLAL